ncbi:hypothetical protein BLNAU_1063 [Blattamonas nauphoetae]|uniref:protein-serine/threonine phosphatase n=1 Tax=Blattamonas nauphoetae TaxID=2049346 RepID=A0ABQ9YJP8_9EUKA|nr:hypothetical protein BLNAU_1063 [Blattamonas nauphoetae]
MFLLLSHHLFEIIFSNQLESESNNKSSDTAATDSSLPFSFPPQSLSELDRLESHIRSGYLFPEWFISQTLSKFESAFNDTPPILSLPSDHWTQGTHICDHSTHIIGDLDGNLTSLLTILRETGLPSDTNRFVFLGNMIGNSPTSLETLLLLFSLKLEHSSSIVLILGRNEHSAISATNSTANLHFFSKYAGNSTAETQHSPSALSDQLSAALTTLPLGLVIERLTPNEQLRMDLGGLYKKDKPYRRFFKWNRIDSIDLSQNLLLVDSGFPITDSTESDFKKLQLKDLNTTEMKKTLLGMRRNGTGMEGKEEQDRLSFISQILHNKPSNSSQLFHREREIDYSRSSDDYDIIPSQPASHNDRSKPHQKHRLRILNLFRGGESTHSERPKPKRRIFPLRSSEEDIPTCFSWFNPIIEHPLPNPDLLEFMESLKRMLDIYNLRRPDINTPAFFIKEEQTTGFLETNNVSMLIRADESLPSGYSLAHSKSIISIGAASTADGSPRLCFLSLTFRKHFLFRNKSYSEYRPVLIARRILVDEKTQSFSDNLSKGTDRYESLNKMEPVVEFLVKILVFGGENSRTTDIIRKYTNHSSRSRTEEHDGVTYYFQALHGPNKNTILQIVDLPVNVSEEQIKVHAAGVKGAIFVQGWGDDRLATFVEQKALLNTIAATEGTPTPIPAVFVRFIPDNIRVSLNPTHLDKMCEENGFLGWNHVSLSSNVNIDKPFSMIGKAILQ